MNHIEIYVSDLEQTKTFYQFLLVKLGFKLYQEWETGFSYIKNDFYLVFVQVQKKFSDKTYHRCQVGLNHLAFTIASKQDLNDLRSELLKRQIPLLYDDKYPFAGGDEKARLFCEDPDRIKIEIVAEEEI